MMYLVAAVLSASWGLLMYAFVPWPWCLIPSAIGGIVIGYTVSASYDA